MAEITVEKLDMIAWFTSQLRYPVQLAKIANFVRMVMSSTCVHSAAPCSTNISPGSSIAWPESMSACDSWKSAPEIKYVDNNAIDMEAAVSAVSETCRKVYLSERVEEAAESSIPAGVEATNDDKIANIDDANFVNPPPLCATMVSDIYKHLRASEAKKRPSMDYTERVQKDIDPAIRSILVNWLLEVAEVHEFVPETPYLAVNYIDRYLSGNTVHRKWLQLVGVACMMIAAKHEEVGEPRVEYFCSLTDDTYSKEEVLQMESAVLNFLKFEMTAPTAKCFLRLFVRAAQGDDKEDQVPSMKLECLANYVAELSLPEYNMLCYAPSTIAASAVFLAKYILLPSKSPWNSTLLHYTLYQPSDLCDCIMALHSLCRSNSTSSLPEISERYSQEKYKYVAEEYCPPSIPSEYFQNLSC